MNHYRIEGNADLARDPKNNSIINVNTMDYEQYMARRSAKMEKNQKVQSIEQEVASMKSDINEIKSLLKEFLNGSR
jgi:uncharacterized HAD superfamily protein